MAKKIPAVDAALRIRRSYNATIRLVLTGALDGGKDAKGAWVVSSASVDRFLEREQAARKRATIGTPKAATA